MNSLNSLERRDDKMVQNDVVSSGQASTEAAPPRRNTKTQKGGDFARRLRTGLTLIIVLVLPMLYSPMINLWILRCGIILAGIEWYVSKASLVGLAVWFVPSILLVDKAMEDWPGRVIALETLWIVLIYSDSAQLVVGRKFGRIKAIPSISPNKSVEGYIGGLLAAFLLARYLHGWTAIPTILVLVFGCIGDLYFSFFKRQANLKDFSTLLGPHGGICDRIDSFVFALIALYTWGEIVGEQGKQEFIGLRYLNVT